MKARYDPREDRMLLVLKPGETEHRLWVTRRQWMALYQQVAARAPKGEDTPMPPSPRPKPLGPEDVAQAVPLETVRIKATDDGVQLVFVSVGGNVGIGLRPQGLTQLKRMLDVQADRAGWDTAAAMKRLKAESLAGAAVKRAKS